MKCELSVLECRHLSSVSPAAAAPSKTTLFPFLSSNTHDTESLFARGQTLKRLRATIQKVKNLQNPLKYSSQVIRSSAQDLIHGKFYAIALRAIGSLFFVYFLLKANAKQCLGATRMFKNDSLI